MNIIDIIILICCVPAIVRGVTKGFVSQAIALVSIVLGAWVSFKLSTPLGNWLRNYVEISGTVIQTVCFSIILLAVVVVTNIYGKFVERIVKLVMLGWLNKLLGAVFALLNVILVLGLIFIIIDAINATLPVIPTKAMDESLLYQPVKDIANSVFPYIKEMIFNK